MEGQGPRALFRGSHDTVFRLFFRRPIIAFIVNTSSSPRRFLLRHRQCHASPLVSRMQSSQASVSVWKACVLFFRQPSSFRLINCCILVRLINHFHPPRSLSVSHIFISVIFWLDSCTFVSLSFSSLHCFSTPSSNQSFS